MTPFQEFRLWARRAPLGERAAAAVASLLVLALLGWVLVPNNSAPTANASLSSDQGAAAPGATDTGTQTGPGPTAAGDRGSTGSGGSGSTLPAGSSGTATQSGSGSSSGGRAAPAAASAGSTAPATSSGGARKAASCRAGSARGTTDQRIKIAVVLVSIAGPAANSVFGIATPAQQKRYYNAVIADVNGRGGAGCRQLVPQYYEANPVDHNQLQSVCLDIAQGGFFAVIDGGAYAQYPLVDCYARNKIPYFGTYLLDGVQQQQYYPYLFNFNTQHRLYRDAAFALRDLKIFSGSAFKKLGFVYRGCSAELINKIKGWYGEAGVSADKLVTYDVGCPNGLVSPSDLQQAVLKFDQAGVTHVTTASFVGDFASFTKIAEQQGFRPRYVLANDSVIPLTYGSQAPDYNNIEDAIAIAASSDAEDRTAGTTKSAGTLRCNAAFKKAGLKTVYEEPAGGGNACSVVWMFTAAVDNAPVLQPNALGAGLQAAKSVDFSFPQGPNDFSKPKTTTAAQFWRPAQFTTSCNCWRLLNKNFSKSYG